MPVRQKRNLDPAAGTEGLHSAQRAVHGDEILLHIAFDPVAQFHGEVPRLALAVAEKSLDQLQRCIVALGRSLGPGGNVWAKIGSVGRDVDGPM